MSQSGDAATTDTLGSLLIFGQSLAGQTTSRRPDGCELVVGDLGASMRVVVVECDRSVSGGAELYVAELCQELEALGMDLLRIDWTTAVSQYRAARIVERLPIRIPTSLKYAITCRHAVQTTSRPLILANGEAPVKVPDRVVATILHAPAIYGIGSQYFEYLDGGLKKWTRVVRSAVVLVARLIGSGQPKMPVANGVVIANSPWTAAQAVALGVIQEKPIVCPPTTRVLSTLAPVASTAPSAERISPKPLLCKPLVVGLGRLVPNKRWLDAIAIVEEAREYWPDCELVIAGRGSGSFVRQLHKAAGRHSWCTILEDPTDAQLSRLFQHAHVGLHCYRHEHFGMAVAEMIACGLVPVVFDGGGVVDLVPDGNLRFTDIESGVSALHFALTNYHCHSLSTPTLTASINGEGVARAAAAITEASKPIGQTASN